MKFCKDCKYFIPWSNKERLELSDCSHPDCSRLPDGYMVTGAKSEPMPCQLARVSGGPCGTDAKLFSPKE